MSVELQGFTKTEKRFTGIEKKLNDLPERFTDEVGSILLSDIQNTFSQRGPGWDEHDPDTKPGIGLLQKSGSMLGAITIRRGRGKNTIERYLPRKFYYGWFHEKGVPKPKHGGLKGRVPQRQFMAKLADAAWQLILEAGKKHLFN